MHDVERPDELRPPPPPAFDSGQTRQELAELKAFKRTPKSNHRPVYWEVFGGRGYTPSGTTSRGQSCWNTVTASVHRPPHARWRRSM